MQYRPPSSSPSVWRPVIGSLVVSFFTVVGYASIHSSFGLDTNQATENIIVKYKPGSSGQAATSAIAGTPGVRRAHVNSIDPLNLQIVEVASSERDKVIADLESDPSIQYAEPDYLQENDATPNDTSYTNQWQIPAIKMDGAWDRSKGSGVVVAVIDSGINTSHPDLAGKYLPGTDVFSNDDDPTDEYKHGTWVSGTIAAATNNGLGVAGTCWDCKVLPVKVQGDSGTYPSSYAIKGVQWAADHGADIINISSGGGSFQQSYQDAVNYAVGKGAIVFASVGNEGVNTKQYPAAYDNVIAVAGTEKNDQRSTYSNYGDWTDLAAPFSALTTDNPGTGYITVNGTSFSTPIASAAAAVLLSAYPNANVQQLTDALTKTADPCCSNQVPNGRINTVKALDYLAALFPSTDPVKQGDLNGDKKVNLTDLSMLLSRWNTTDTSTDLNKSGKVDLTDLSILLSNWTG